MHEDRSFNLRYHEGMRYDIYAANVGDQLFITLIFDRRMGASRISMVWLYVKRAIQALLPLVASEETPATPDVLPTEFSTLLSNKLNAIFGAT
jgi:hypothetical protein